ncbi:MAG: hypothetical protein QME73_10010, partial [Bacillota bacterium]|nr:hypothetical protein [Bacillota bacterium]
VERGVIKNAVNRSRKHVIIVLPSEETKNDFSILDFIKKNKMDKRGFRQTCCNDAARLLDSIGIAYRVHMIEAEFGQPFYSIEESLEFFRYYYPELRDKDRELGEWLESKLQVDANHGYYLPSTKKSAVLILDTQRR